MSEVNLKPTGEITRASTTRGGVNSAKEVIQLLALDATCRRVVARVWLRLARWTARKLAEVSGSKGPSEELIKILLTTARATVCRAGKAETTVRHPATLALPPGRDRIRPLRRAGRLVAHSRCSRPPATAASIGSSVSGSFCSSSCSTSTFEVIQRCRAVVIGKSSA